MRLLSSAFVLGLVLLSPPPAGAQDVVVKAGALGNVAGSLSNADYIAYGMLGQLAIGVMSGDLYSSEGGFSYQHSLIQFRDFADHNVGNCVLTVTDQGILGFMDVTQDEGSGFVYPIDGSNRLCVGSLWVGESETYVANRDYDRDPAKEWTVSVDPDGHLWVDDSGWLDGNADSNQDIYASYTDAGAVRPRGLLVDQESWAFAEPDPADDLVMVRCTIRNNGAGPLSGLYVGLFLDYDLNTFVSNWGSTDPTCNLVYMTDTSTIHVGLQLLQDEFGDPPQANLTLIHNPTYVWPNQYILDADKHKFLSAAGPEYVVNDAPDPDDWGVLASAGPFALTMGEEQMVCFALVGGENLEALRENAHIAELIYQKGIQDAPPADLVPHTTRLMPSTPNPFCRQTVVRFDLAQPGDVKLAVYDVGGRLVRTLARGPHVPMRYALTWDGRDETGRVVPSGAYFMKLATGDRSEIRRLVHVR